MTRMRAAGKPACTLPREPRRKRRHFPCQTGLIPMHPNGHAALVTGGGSGLGHATAARLVALGTKVTILDINGEAARGAAAKIGAIGIACDVTSSDATVAAIAEARAA